jgi:hypothetical protein
MPDMTYFDRFRARYSAPIHTQPATADTIREYASAVPAPLVELWRDTGWCGFDDGFLWLTDPGTLAEFVTPFLPAELISGTPIVRTAFADVIVWAPSGAYLVRPRFGEINFVGTSINSLFNNALTDKKILNTLFEHSLFKKALKRLGPIDPDECYGFFPALALGGPGTVETLQKAMLREHLVLLAEMLE